MGKLQISLAAARINAKKTQSDVAKEMHVSKQTIVNWENGKSYTRQRKRWILNKEPV